MFRWVPTDWRAPAELVSIRAGNFTLCLNLVTLSACFIHLWLMLGRGAVESLCWEVSVGWYQHRLWDQMTTNITFYLSQRHVSLSGTQGVTQLLAHLSSTIIGRNWSDVFLFGDSSALFESLLKSLHGFTWGHIFIFYCFEVWHKSNLQFD